MSNDDCSKLGLFGCIHNFVVATANNELTGDQLTDFEQLLWENDDACRMYFRYVEESDFLQRIFDAMPDEDFPSPDVFAVDPPGPTGTPSALWFRTLPYLSSGWPVAYLIATVIFAIGGLIGTFTYVSQPSQIARQPDVSDPQSLIPNPSSVVGQITGMIDCKWNGSAAKSQDVALGGRYELASGLIEITYNTGARVILQGPCSYTVDSAVGGYLAVGKITARVEKRGGGREAGDGTVASDRKGASGQWLVASDNHQTAIRHSPSAISNPQSPIPNSSASPVPRPAPLFTIKTPTATVADLGTEFGVEVTSSGTTKTQVFQGAVELRIDQDGDMASRKVLRPQDGTTCVDVSETHRPRIRHVDAEPDVFVREMPKFEQVPLRVFSTGVGVAEGEPDPHWQIVAVSNDPKFQPRQATVTTPCEEWLQNNSGSSQWISLVGDASPLPGDTTYTFRTTFELGNVRLETVNLVGFFLADNRMQEIRLNGHSVPLPEQGERRRDPFELFHKFVLDGGFVAGVNVLEFDVKNGDGSLSDSNPMGLRVELHGSARQECNQSRVAPTRVLQKGG